MLIVKVIYKDQQKPGDEPVERILVSNIMDLEEYFIKVSQPRQVGAFEKVLRGKDLEKRIEEYKDNNTSSMHLDLFHKNSGKDLISSSMDVAERMAKSKIKALKLGPILINAAGGYMNTSNNIEIVEVREEEFAPVEYLITSL